MMWWMCLNFGDNMTIDFTNPAGKGAQPRPFSNYDQYKTNWDLIFGKKKKEPVAEEQQEPVDTDKSPE